MRRLLACLLALPACGGAPARDEAPARPAPTCASVAGHVGDVLASGFVPRPPDEVVNQLIGVVRTSCEQDAWAASALACFAAARTLEALKGCEPALTEAQQAGLVRRQEEVRALDGQLRPGPAAPAPE